MLFLVGAFVLTIESRAVTDIDVHPLDAIGAVGDDARERRARRSASQARWAPSTPFSPFAKSVMILLMWAGRLEIIPVAVLLTRRYWRA